MRSLRSVRGVDVERIAYLTPQQEARLLASYSQWAAPVMLMLCETGLRTQEALRLDWRHIDWQGGVIVVEHSGRGDGPRTKTGKSRRVGMRPAVRDALLAIWEKRDRPDTGHGVPQQARQALRRHPTDGWQPIGFGASHCLPQGRHRWVPNPRLATPLRRLVPQARRQPSGALPDRRMVEHDGWCSDMPCSSSPTWTRSWRGRRSGAASDLTKLGKVATWMKVAAGLSRPWLDLLTTTGSLAKVGSRVRIPSPAPGEIKHLAAGFVEEAQQQAPVQGRIWAPDSGSGCSPAQPARRYGDPPCESTGISPPG